MSSGIMEIHRWCREAEAMKINYNYSKNMAIRNESSGLPSNEA